MKFGNKLREQSDDVFDREWRNHVLDYKGLKKAIGRLRRAQQAGEDTSAQLQQWFVSFSAELRKFDPFYIGRVEAAQAAVEIVEQALTASKDGKKSPKPDELKELYLQLQELKFFGELNRTGCRKILKKLDKNIESCDSQERFRGELEKLAVSNCWRVTELSERVASVHACLHHEGKGRKAQMALDYHVNCVSDIFAHMLSHAGLGHDQVRSPRPPPPPTTAADAPRSSGEGMDDDSGATSPAPETEDTTGQPPPLLQECASDWPGGVYPTPCHT